MPIPSFIYLYAGLFPKGFKAASDTLSSLTKSHSASNTLLMKSPVEPPLSEMLTNVFYLTLKNKDWCTQLEVLEAYS